MTSIKVKVTFTQSILGTQTGDKDIYREYIGSKAPDAQTIEQEVEAVGVDEVVEKGKTWFPKTKDGVPFIYDYQIKGFFKSACGALRAVKGTKSSGVKAYKKLIDLGVFVQDRMNVFEDFAEFTECQRPLRAQTMQGERVSIAISEEIPAGATCTFTVNVLDDSNAEIVKEWLDYGRFNGIGQWRNGSHGQFTWELIEESSSDWRKAN